eukprot:scaffold2114_cov95-Isochrysis_galbana.AAC.7
MARPGRALQAPQPVRSRREAPQVQSPRGAPQVQSRRGAPQVQSPRGAPQVQSPRGAPQVQSPRGAPQRGAAGAEPKRGAAGAEPKRGAAGAEPKRGAAAGGEPKRDGGWTVGPIGGLATYVRGRAVRSALSCSSCFLISGPTAAPTAAGAAAAPGGRDVPGDEPAVAAAVPKAKATTPLPFIVVVARADVDGGGAAGGTAVAPKLNTPVGAPPASFAGDDAPGPKAAGPDNDPPIPLPLAVCPNVQDGGGALNFIPESDVPPPPKGAPKGDALSVVGAPKLKHPPAAPVGASAAAAVDGVPLPKVKTGAAAGAVDAEDATATLPPNVKAAPPAEAGTAGPPKLKAGAGPIIAGIGAGAGAAVLPKAPKAKAGAAAAGAKAGAVALKENAPPAGAAGLGATSWTFANGFDDSVAGADPSARSIPELGTGRFARRTLRARIVSCGAHTGEPGQCAQKDRDQLEWRASVSNALTSSAFRQVPCSSPPPLSSSQFNWCRLSPCRFPDMCNRRPPSGGRASVRGRRSTRALPEVGPVLLFFDRLSGGAPAPPRAALIAARSGASPRASASSRQKHLTHHSAAAALSKSSFRCLRVLYCRFLQRGGSTGLRGARPSTFYCERPRGPALDAA